MNPPCAERGITLARRSIGRKVDHRLLVSSMHSAHQISRYTQHLQRLGPPALALDAGLRTGQVVTVHSAGGNWHRESAVQMGRLVVGAASGAAAGIAMKGSTAAVLAGPMGWAVLGVISVVALGIYLASSAGSKAGESIGGLTYDKVMSFWK